VVKLLVAHTNNAADLSQEPGCQKAKQHGIVGLAVKPRHANVTKLPQLTLPAVQRPGSESHINQNNIGTALNKPSAKVDLWKNGDKVVRSKKKKKNMPSPTTSTFLYP